MPPRRPLVYTALSAVSFALLALSAKLAMHSLPGAEVAFLRFALMMVPLLIVPGLGRKALTFERLDLLIYRGLFGGFAVLLYFLALSHVPIGTATLLNYSSPIFSVLFATLFLGESVRPWVLLPAAVAFLGVGLVTGGLAPGGLLAHFGRWEAAGLFSAVLSGASVAAIRAARRTESSWAIYGSFTLFGLITTAPFGLHDWRTPTGREALLLLVVGGTSIAAQMLMTYAYRWVTNVQAGAMAQLTVLISFGLGALLLDDPFGWQQAIGCTLTLAGILGVVRVQAAPRAIE
ncbi:MAG: DMT family transporter [Thermoanaerobaculia bacterium]